MKRVLLYLFACLALLLPASSALAATVPTSSPDKGLLISPLRDYVSLNAGERKAAVLTVANLTSQVLTVDLSIKQFSVTNYTYNYDFRDPNDWLQFSKNQLTLQPGSSESVTYFVTVPAGTAAGGQYYTLLASAQVGSGSLISTIRAASLLYITVNGTLLRTSELIASSVPRVVFSKEFTYTLDVKNTGNVHYFAYYSGQLHGPTAQGATGASHILLPDSIRRVTGDIKSPLLPGIYKATFGYKTDAGATVQRSKFILYLPPWSLAFVAVLALVGWNIYGRRRNRSSSDSEDTSV